MESMDMSAILTSITCPITQDVMRDPVQGKDGQTYERSAIIAALNIKQESPITRERMTVNDLKVNSSIRFLCDKYHSGAFGSFGLPNITESTSQNTSSSLNIKIDHNITKNKEGKIMLTFNVNPEDYTEKMQTKNPPQDVVLVIDRSGSMDTAVEAKDSNGDKLENGMSIQDIVNHSAKTVAKTLDPNSRLAVVIFDNTIQTLFDFVNMNDMNTGMALGKIANIKPGGQTNIWGGIDRAFSLIDSRSDKSRNAAVFLLTDGSPNISPSRGEVETLKRNREKDTFNSPIYTFGFGYNLAKDLLYDVAKYGDGGNGHIPDGAMIATVFCNFTGTILTTVATNLKLHVKRNNKFSNFEVLGDFPSIKSDQKDYTTYLLGTIQYEQARNIILGTDVNSEFSYYYTYNIGNKVVKSEEVKINREKNSGLLLDDLVDINYARTVCVESIRTMIGFKICGDIDSATSLYTQTVEFLKDVPGNNSLIKGLINNFEDQVKLAVFNDAYFRKWGQYYLDQLSRSINQEMKPNFKDPGCLFGGKMFESIVDKASDIFDTLDPPEPSLINRTNYYGYGASTSTATRAVTLSSYNDINGGCMHSECIITLGNGFKKKIGKVQKDDILMTLDENGEFNKAKVVCVVETTITKGLREMVSLENGLLITPWHPIMKNGNWVFPSSLNNSTMVSCNSMITLVMEKHHVVIVNDIPCITLGHNFKGDVIEHDYYGTNRVIEDLTTQIGWVSGHINIKDVEVNYVKLDDKVERVIFPNSIRSPATLVTC